jgi:hypothetical protein
MAALRIGELLVAQNKLRATELARALAEQPHTGGRLCSLLIRRGLLDFDDAARALSAQKGVPCALRKHLEHRDRSLVGAIPAALGRSMCALPIARTRSGQLIVCVRDPAPQLESAIRQQVRDPFVMIVAPAQLLEEAVGEVYGAVPSDEFDVDMSTGPIALPFAPLTPPRPNMALLDPDSIQLALTSLDDDRVAKDPTQSGHNLPSFSATLPPPISDQLPVITAPQPLDAGDFGTRDAGGPGELDEQAEDFSIDDAYAAADAASDADEDSAPPAPSFDELTMGLARSTHRDGATEHALTYMRGRWTTGLVLALRGQTGVGYRGYGEALPAVETISVPLGVPSMLQRAIDTKRTSVARPQSAAQRQLEALLGVPEFPAAAPVLVAGHVVAVLAVGDPTEGAGAFEEATADLALVAEALSSAYERIHARR